MTSQERWDWGVLVARTLLQLRIWLCEQDGSMIDFDRTTTHDS